MIQDASSLVYIAAAVLFVLALKWLTAPPTARRGVLAGELGMVLAVAATLLSPDIASFRWILVALFAGSAIGIPMAVFMPMTAMPQRIALSHAFGALAAALVGSAEFYLQTPHLARFTMAAIALEVILGFLTFTGSLMAFGKLQGLLPDRPLVYRGQNAMNLSLLALALGAAVYLVINPSATALFPLIVLLALLFGVLLILPIGGADMPTVISLLNSYAGLSGAAMGFVLDNKLLIVAGALDGSSGFLLSIIMCRAMNRSFANVLFGAFGQCPVECAAGLAARPARSASPEEAAELLGAARLVIIVPGYGLAVAQAQHALRSLTADLERRGVRVIYGIHPVAGRMPGHMNVLLAEVDVSYDQLLDLEQSNAVMERTDVALVVGANDVVNPAARDDRSSPIYGMPIIEVDRARFTVVIKRSLASGFAGIDNPLFYKDGTAMLFADAKKALTDLLAAMAAV